MCEPVHKHWKSVNGGWNKWKLIPYSSFSICRHLANDSIAPFEAVYGEMFANPVTPTPELVNIIRPFFAFRIWGRTVFVNLNAPK